MNIKIEKTQISQKEEILHLYRSVSHIKDGLIRKASEITEQYIKDFMTNALGNGLSLVARDGEVIIGEIHANTPDIFAFQHILTDLTVAVRNEYQGKGVGRNLFTAFLHKVKNDFTHIYRIELYTREHNHRNVQFDVSLGFVNEGRQKNKIYISESEFETPLHMAWFNPNYNETAKFKFKDCLG